MEPDEVQTGGAEKHEMLMDCWLENVTFWWCETLENHCTCSVELFQVLSETVTKKWMPKVYVRGPKYIFKASSGHFWEMLEALRPSRPSKSHRILDTIFVGIDLGWFLMDSGITVNGLGHRFCFRMWLGLISQGLTRIGYVCCDYFNLGFVGTLQDQFLYFASTFYAVGVTSPPDPSSSWEPT